MRNQSSLHVLISHKFHKFFTYARLETVLLEINLKAAYLRPQIFYQEKPLISSIFFLHNISLIYWNRDANILCPAWNISTSGLGDEISTRLKQDISPSTRTARTPNFQPSISRRVLAETKSSAKSANNPWYNRSDTLYVQHTRLLLYPSTGGAPPPVRSSFKYVPAICAKQSSLPRTIQPEQLALDIMAGVCTTQPHARQRLLPPFGPRPADRDRAPHSFPINSRLFSDRYLSREPRRAAPRLSVIKTFSAR